MRKFPIRIIGLRTFFPFSYLAWNVPSGSRIQEQLDLSMSDYESELDVTEVSAMTATPADPEGPAATALAMGIHTEHQNKHG